MLISFSFYINMALSTGHNNQFSCEDPFILGVCLFLTMKLTVEICGLKLDRCIFLEINSETIFATGRFDLRTFVLGLQTFINLML
jgi:hypothetical protein